ncbi:hypothetical protein ACFLY3_05540 [Chloroflexota bacterium]
MVVVGAISAYDLIIAQGFPKSDWPTISSWLPTWDWWVWVILILILVLLAVAEGSYRLNKKQQKEISDSKERLASQMKPLPNRKELMESIAEAKIAVVEYIKLMEIREKTNASPVYIDALNVGDKEQERYKVAIDELEKQITVAGSDYHPILKPLLLFIQSGGVMSKSAKTILNFKYRLDKIIEKAIEDIDNLNQQAFRKEGFESQEELRYEIIWLSETFFLKDSRGGYQPYNRTNEEGMISLIVRANIKVDTLKIISVQSITLEIGGQLIPWGEDDVNVFGESITDEYEFTFPLTTPRGKQLAKIKAMVDGQEYMSPKPFIIDFPRKVFK